MTDTGRGFLFSANARLHSYRASPRQVKKCEVATHGELGTRSYNSGLGRSSSGAQGQSPHPLKLKTFQLSASNINS